MNNQCVAETQGRLHFSALHEKSASPARLHRGQRARKVSEPGPAAPWTSIFKFKYSGRNCDGLKVLSWTEGVQEQLSTNCAAYAHSAAPGHSVSAAAQAGPGGRAHPISKLGGT